MLDREVYIPTPGHGVSMWVFAGYLDAAGTRHERLIVSGDDGQRQSERTSTDNGRTWTDFAPIEGLERQLPSGGIRTIPGLYFHEPHLDMLYQTTMRRVWPDMKIHTYKWKTMDHPMIRMACLGVVVANEYGKMNESYSYGESFDKIFEKNKSRVSDISYRDMRRVIQ